jgi:hypothetical protein
VSRMRSLVSLGTLTLGWIVVVVVG